MTIGHNNPPDPIDEALTPYGDAIAEAENWLDGTQVETEDQMRAVDDLIKLIRKAKTDLGKARDSATAPLHDAWKKEIARWKPTSEDIDRRLKGLVAIVDAFKRQLAAEKERARAAAEAEARRKAREAADAARLAQAGNYESEVAAAKAAEEAKAAQEAATAAKKDTVKGLRAVTKYEVDDEKALLHWIAKNDRAAVRDFIHEWARKNHKAQRHASGLRVWDDKEAF